MPSTTWRGSALGGIEETAERCRGRRSLGQGDAGARLSRRGEKGGHQKPATAKLPAELGGEPIGDPGASDLVEQGQAPQADGKANKKLQDGFEHAR